MHNRDYQSTKWGRVNIDRSLYIRFVAERAALEDATGKPVTPKIAKGIQSTVTPIETK